MADANRTDRLAASVYPPRLDRFRRNLIKAIPRVPNDKASLRHMEAKHLPELLIDYVNWRSRYVGERPRNISIEPAAQFDPRWSIHGAQVSAFLRRVEQGEDLTPHLSLKPHTRGYAPAARVPGATRDQRWSDKDFLLNVMGYHHFHLGASSQQPGHVDRTNEMIFAEVLRETFKVIAIFDHDVFHPGSAERMRLWALHESIISRGLPPGTVVAPALIATSGHALHVVEYAKNCARLIRDIEPNLDDPEYVKGLYRPPTEAPAESKLSWIFQHLDLVIYDEAKPRGFVVKCGWN